LFTPRRLFVHLRDIYGRHLRAQRKMIRLKYFHIIRGAHPAHRESYSFSLAHQLLNQTNFVEVLSPREKLQMPTINAALKEMRAAVTPFLRAARGPSSLIRMFLQF
jgi:hypothetical protein